jgi:Leucine-rich repeat (LRR) protein
VLASLAGLTGLQSLRLTRNGLTSEQLEAAPLPAPRLTRLVLAGNQLRALPAGVAALTGLVDLDLSATMISALPAAGHYLGTSQPPLSCPAGTPV